MESEWGRWNDSKLTFVDVMEDAWKLTVVNAVAKVMVFGSQATANRQEIVGALNRLREQSGDTAPMLWIDVPWETDGDLTARRLGYGVLT